MMFPSLTVKSLKKPWPVIAILVPPWRTFAGNRERARAKCLLEAGSASVSDRAGNRIADQFLDVAVVTFHRDAAVRLGGVGLDGVDSTGSRVKFKAVPERPVSR